MNISWLFKIAIALFSNSFTANAGTISKKDYNSKDYFMLEISELNNLNQIKKLHPDWVYEHQSRVFDKYHIFSLPKNHTTMDSLGNYNSNDYKLVKRDNNEFLDTLIDNGIKSIHMLPPKKLERRAPVPLDLGYDHDYDAVFRKRAIDSSQERIGKVEKEFGINDPIFKDQWHIINTNFPGDDVNVIPVWKMNITGNNVVTAIIDDGLDYENPDLKNNFCAKGSWDYNDDRALPKPMLSNDYHGTRCAGEIAAGKGDEFCGVGVAYNSKVSGIRILSAEITSEEEAHAMIHALEINDIYSCSWGPPDNGKTMDVPDKIVREAILKGIQDGRNKKGALYVFASGNGAAQGDSCNFDGYTNSIYSITVSALDHKGLHPPYAESCSAVMVTTYSSGSGEYIHTTDIKDKCSVNHGGTSAAAPLAAGIYALVLDANPELTWRDVQYLTVLSAVEVDSQGGSWQDSAIEGRRYSRKYGWGKIDAEKMIKMSQNNWKFLKPQSWYYTPYQKVNLKIEKERTTVEGSFQIKSEILEKANFEKIEQITVTIDIDSLIRGKVEVKLISPNGIESQLAVSRSRDRDPHGFQNWTFSTVAHWGELGVGEWKIQVSNVDENNVLNFKGWQLKAFGESIDEKKAKRFNLDEDYANINFSNESNGTNDTTTTTSLSTSLFTELSFSTETKLSTNISSRPVTSITPSPIADSSKENEMGNVITSVKPSKTSTPSSDEDQGDGSYKQNKSNSNYIGYFLFIILVGFSICICLIKKRKQPGRARRREDFEFDIIHPDDTTDDFDVNSEINDEYADNNSNQTDDEDDDYDIFADSSRLPRNSMDANTFREHIKDEKKQQTKKKLEDDEFKIRDEERDQLFRLESNDDSLPDKK